MSGQTMSWWDSKSQERPPGLKSFPRSLSTYHISQIFAAISLGLRHFWKTNFLKESIFFTILMKMIDFLRKMHVYMQKYIHTILHRCSRFLWIFYSPSMDLIRNPKTLYYFLSITFSCLCTALLTSMPPTPFLKYLWIRLYKDPTILT